MHGCPFDVVEIMYSVVLWCIYKERDNFKSPRAMKPVLVFSSLVVRVCLRMESSWCHRFLWLSCLEPLFDNFEGVSVHMPEQVPQSDLVGRYNVETTSTGPSII